jgi:hypothetical protein
MLSPSVSISRSRLISRCRSFSRRSLTLSPAAAAGGTWPAAAPAAPCGPPWVLIRSRSLAASSYRSSRTAWSSCSWRPSVPPASCPGTHMCATAGGAFLMPRACAGRSPSVAKHIPSPVPPPRRCCDGADAGTARTDRGSIVVGVCSSAPLLSCGGGAGRRQEMS